MARCTGIAQSADQRPVLAHEHYVEDVLGSATLPLDDPRAMFAYILERLPDRAKIFPTENYYYFSFIHHGVGYSGNIRLDAKDRDQGKLHCAYFEDFASEKFLIGVFADNARDNNHLDGPFDQLPDNFIQRDALRRSILEVDPRLAGKIDRFGSFLDGSGRYLIAPYLHYRKENDLAVFDNCATSKGTIADHYYACFVTNRINGKRAGRKETH